MLHSPDFTTLKNSEQIDLVRLKVRDLGFSSVAETSQIYTRAEELGLELCPAEVGPYQRLNDKDQPMNNWYWIAMKQITDRGGRPRAFYLEHARRADGLWLRGDWARLAVPWDLDDELVFRLRPSTRA